LFERSDSAPQFNETTLSAHIVFAQSFKDGTNDVIASRRMKYECVGAVRSGAREEFRSQQLVGAMQPDFYVCVGE